MRYSLFRLRLFLVIIGVPLLIAGAIVGLMVSWFPSLPNRVIVHWGPDGTRLGSPDAYLFLVGGITVIMCAVFGAMVLATTRSRRIGVMQKVIGVTPIFYATLLSGLAIVMLDAQRGAHASITVANPPVRIVAAILACGVLTAGAWFALPKAAQSTGGDSGVAIHPLAVGPGERIVWIRRVRTPIGFWVSLGIVALGLVVGAVLAVIRFGLDYWWILLWPVMIIVILATSLAWLVQIDAGGLRVHSSVGFPRFRVPIDQIERVSVVSVAPLADFGGWGIRWVPPHRFGVIVRTGEALEVFRHDGRSFVVTVDDAEGAANALAGLIERDNPPSS